MLVVHLVDHRLMLLQGFVIHSHAWWYWNGDTGEVTMIV
jgi:hypothetical protein